MINMGTNHSTEDLLKDLAIRSQQGDTQAYAEFLQKLTPYIQGALRKKLGSLVDQEDLAQECLMGIHKNLKSYHPSQPLKPWISAIIRYKLADHFRKLSRTKEQLLGDEILDVTIDPSQANESMRGSKTDVTQILSQLPDKLRRPLEMTHIQGLSYGEAAEKEGITEGALRKRLSRAFSKIRNQVNQNMEVPFE